MNAVLLLFGAAGVRMWRRRRPKAEEEAERWDAFRRYLTDFPRLKEAPPATLELWERFLVYGIAFGIAERVLQGAQLHMPEELHNASTIYWISPYGDLGSGPSALGISDLSAGFGSALSPPSSSGSGGSGGGFSGGGAEAAAGVAAEPGSYWEGLARKRRTPTHAATMPPVASPTRFVVTQVRQALQQTAAAGACSPYFAAVCDTRSVKTLRTERSLASWVASGTAGKPYKARRSS